ncbi:methylamine utilization protein [Motilimonas eburnea]|uniref:methylamine utilization protein n=1 Tax=Motilimonas eburnea TaxID=1737488 RepID=UPI001E56104E|nr:methylamine utilization protein [Motilimonas eburnea]MCE2572732.1 methylamine utilization protein [Motilimonas eburnea]
MTLTVQWLTVQWRSKLMVMVVAWVICWPALSEQWQVKVIDHLGEPLPNAVVELTMSTDPDVDPSGLTPSQPYNMIQQHKQFQPFVLAVPVGAEVDFPNLDATRHHVYSFSKAKTFEIKLYKDRPHSPILFDKPGVVALGCNIHDRMQAHIYVASSPWVAVTDANGMVVFTDLKPAPYQVKLWHPWQKKQRETIEVNFNRDRADQFKVFAVKPELAFVGSPRY